MVDAQEKWTIEVDEFRLALAAKYVKITYHKFRNQHLSSDRPGASEELKNENEALKY